MNNFIKNFFLFSLLMVLLSAPCLAENLNIDKNATTQAFMDEGFQVNEGKMETIDIMGMYDAGISSSCYGNNPSAPYMTFKVPKAPGQTCNNSLSDAPIEPDNAGLWLDFHMRPDEAFVYIGITPPECEYFSYADFLSVRYFPDTDEHRRVYASLEDTINLDRLKEEPAYLSGVFSKPIVLILTADKNADLKARDALLKAGYQDTIIHTLTIPGPLVHLGLTSTTDTINALHRVALFTNETEGDAYMNSIPGIIYRLTPENESEPDYYEVPELIIRGTGDTRELNLMDDLEELREAIITRYGKDHVEDLTTKIWIFEGYDAIQRGIDALGESRDTVYLNTTETILGSEPGEEIIVYGVNHVATQKATYANFGLYGGWALNGVEGISNKDYSGSAEEYLPNNPDAKYLYVAKISREDDGKNTTSVVLSGVGVNGIEPDEPCFVGYRAYVEPETGIGPEWGEIVYDRAMKINP